MEKPRGNSFPVSPLRTMCALLAVRFLTVRSAADKVRPRGYPRLVSVRTITSPPQATPCLPSAPLALCRENALSASGEAEKAKEDGNKGAPRWELAPCYYWLRKRERSATASRDVEAKSLGKAKTEVQLGERLHDVSLSPLGGETRVLPRFVLLLSASLAC